MISNRTVMNLMTETAPERVSVPEWRVRVRVAKELKFPTNPSRRRLIV